MILIQRVESRLATWKSKYLSFVGQLTLVNSVLSSLPLYFMSLFRLPAWVIKKIDPYRRSFLWSGSSSTNGISCKVNRKPVCLHREEGGLGIKDIHQLNTTFLSKWGWRLLSREPGLWKNQVLFAYHRRSDFLEAGNQPKDVLICGEMSFVPCLPSGTEFSTLLEMGATHSSGETIGFVTLHSNPSFLHCFF